jgi:O-methyltransferase
VTSARELPGKVFRAVTRRDDLIAVRRLLTSRQIRLSLPQRLSLVGKLYRTTAKVQSPHTQAEILAYVDDILTLPDGSPDVVVEAGCFVGSSTAKFSLAAARAGKTLVVFDSFAGIPENDEKHDTDHFGSTDLPGFRAGDWHGELDEVKGNVTRYGEVGVCEFVPGWFDDTMPKFDRPIAAAYIDVDLASSTRTCIQHLFPLLRPGGSLFSQDGHLPLVTAVFEDADFWRGEVGCDPPTVERMGSGKLLRVRKAA